MEVLNTKLSVRNLTKSFDGKTVLNNISFDLYEGEFLSILGPSGCGKTTLLRILIGLEKADSGEILKAGTDISGLKSIDRGMGIVFQNYALFPNMTVLQNVEYALTLSKETKQQAREIALRTLEQVGLTAHRVEDLPAVAKVGACSVAEKLEPLRKASLKFLKDALESE